ncbi:MAG: Penicillin amidase family protein, partial [uncultured Gemmatimonadaceae bacterium]
RLGRRAQLLPAHAPAGHAARHPPLRAVDGAVVQRGEHRRRHRAGEPGAAGGVLRKAPGGRRASRRPLPRAGRLQRLRNRAAEHRQPPRAPPHQPAHLVLLPRRGADDERRGARRVRRGDVGAVLHLPGVQQPRGVDAHLERRRRGGRVRRGGGGARRPLRLPPRRRGARGGGRARGGALPDGRRRAGGARVHRVPHAPRPDRAHRGRPLGERAPDAEAGGGAEPVVPAHEGARLRVVPAGDGARGQLVEQHHLRRRERGDRLLPPAVRAAPRRPPRLGQAGGRERPGDGVARGARGGGRAAPAQPVQRLDHEHQQLALLGRRREQPAARAVPALHGRGGGEPARDPRPARAPGAARLHHPVAHGGRVRQLPAGVRRPRAAARGGPRRAAGGEPAARPAARAGGGAARVGLPVGGAVGAHHARGVLGRGAVGAHERRRGARGALAVPVHGRAHHARGEAAGARRGLRPAGGGLRHLAHRVGRGEPLPAAHRRHRAAVRRRGAEPPGALHLRAVGVARLVRRAPLPGHPAAVRHERQQLRRGGGVRRQRAGPRGHRRRPERRPALAALRRPGGALRRRRPARGVLLPVAARGAHGAELPAGGEV